MGAVDTAIRTRAPSRSRPAAVPAAVAGGAALLVLLVVFAVLAWPGQLPWGSDNDEYLQVASRLVGFDSPLVGGVEGTKYPLGYPALLAVLDVLALPVTRAALVLNVAAAAGTAALVGLTVRRLGLGAVAAFAAAGYVAASGALWGAVYWVMPDALLVLAVAAFLYLAVRLDGGGRIAGGRIAGGRIAGGRIAGPLGLALVVAAATALKSVGLVLGLAAGLGLALGGRERRRWAWLPAGAALAVTGLMALAVAGLPEHTTGYVRTFWLEDVYDASAGEVGASAVVARLWTNLGDTLRDVGWAVAGPQLSVGVAVLLGIVLVALGLVAFRRHWRMVVPVVGFYLLAILVWPFESVRFGLPLLPVAAGGVGLAARGVGRALTERAAAALAVAGVGLFAWWTAPHLARTADLQGAELAAIHQSMDGFEAWAAAHVPGGDRIASLDYREISRALDRPVLPVAYTADPAELWAQTGGAGADWFVVVQAGFHSRRIPVARLLLWKHEERFEPVYANGRIEVYSIRP